MPAPEGIFTKGFIAAPSVFAAKPCKELKSGSAAKPDTKKVVSYTLEIVPNDQVGDTQVVGTCDGGMKQIIHERKESSGSGKTGDARFRTHL